LGQSTGAKRVTSQTIINCQSSGGAVGWAFDHCGSMMTAININAESATGDGITWDNASSGTFLSLRGGEITGNGGIGINATDLVRADDIVFSSNTGGDTSTSVARFRVNEIQTATDESRFIADRFQSPQSTVTLLAADTISDQFQFVRISGNGGAVTLTSDPQIDTPTDGKSQMITLFGGSDTNTVTIKDGQGLRLKADFTMGLEDTLTLAYHSGFGDWIEVARSKENTQAYFTSGASTDRSFNPTTATLNEVGDVLATLIADLVDQGMVR